MTVSLTLALPRYRVGLGLLFFMFPLPVLMPYYLTKGIDPAGFFMIEGLFRLAYFLFSFFTGLISDRWSRRGCLLTGAVLWWIGSFIIFIGHGFWFVAAGEILLAFGMAFYVSSGRAYLYDLLLSLDRAAEHPAHLSRQRALEHVIRMLAMASGGFLFAAWSEAPQFCVLITTAISLLALSGLPEPPRHKSLEKIEHLGHVLEQFPRIAAAHPGLIRLMLYAACLMAASTIVFWSIQPVMHEIKLAPQYIGLAMALAAALTAVFSAAAHRLIKIIGLKPLFIFLLALALFEMYALAFIQHPLVLLLLLSNAFLYAMVTIGFEDLVQRQVTSEIRATTLSLGAMLDMLLSSAALFAIGFMMKAFDLGTALGVMAGIFSLAGLGLLLALLRVFGRLKQDYPDKPL